MAIDVTRFRAREEFAATFAGLIDYVKSPPLAPGVEAVTIPGEPERARRREREASGIPIDDTTWTQLVDAGRSVGVPPPDSDDSNTFVLQSRS
jgi:uncharacterized oxidoreductase